MRSLICGFLIGICSLSQTYAASLNEVLPDAYPGIYKRMSVLPFNDHGWYLWKDIFAKLLADHKIKVVIEVGSWLGASTRDIARQLPEGGKLYAVDHWQGSPEMFRHEDERKLLPTLYQQFLSNVIHAGLTDKIVPVRMPSLEAAEKLKLANIVPDLIYIDGAHDFDSVYKDLVAWYAYVQGDCIFCGDDFTCPDVRDAVKKFAQERNLKLEPQGGFWMMKK